MKHDFRNATVELHGVHTTQTRRRCSMTRNWTSWSMRSAGRSSPGKNLGFPIARDSAIASEVAWAMLHDAVSHDPPVRGTHKELEQILSIGRSMRKRIHGLPVHPDRLPDKHLAVGQSPTACGEKLWRHAGGESCLMRRSRRRISDVPCRTRRVLRPRLLRELPFPR